MSEDSIEVVNPAEDPWAIPPQSVSWDVTPPFTVTGLLIGQEMAIQTNFETKKPLTWEDGRPRKKVIITLAGKPSEDSEDDDGLRTIHARIPSALFASIRDAIKEAGLKTLPVNGTHYIAITYTSDAPQTAAEKRQKRSPAKEFVSLISTESIDSTEPPF